MRRDRQAEADYQEPFVSGKEHGGNTEGSRLSRWDNQVYLLEASLQWRGMGGAGCGIREAGRRCPGQGRVLRSELSGSHADGGRG